MLQTSCRFLVMHTPPLSEVEHGLPSLHIPEQLIDVVVVVGMVVVVVDVSVVVGTVVVVV